MKLFIQTITLSIAATALATDITPVDAAPAAVKRQAADAQRSLQLAQAASQSGVAAPAGVALPPGYVGMAVANNGATALTTRRLLRSAGNSLIVSATEADPKARAELEEDLAVMTRVLDNAVGDKLGEEHRVKAANIDLLLTPGGLATRALYLEDYGAVFLVRVNLPLIAPAAPAEKKTEEDSETDSAWEEARRELYGPNPGNFQVLENEFRFGGGEQPAREYDAGKVSELKEGLLEALKNASRIRQLKPDEFVTICVVGAPSSGAARGKAVQQRVTSAARKKSGDSHSEVFVIRDDGDAGNERGTVMTVRTRKSDIDAFAKGKIALREFQEKAKVALYAGGTGGWGGRFPFAWEVR